MAFESLVRSAADDIAGPSKFLKATSSNLAEEWNKLNWRSYLLNELESKANVKENAVAFGLDPSKDLEEEKAQALTPVGTAGEGETVVKTEGDGENRGDSGEKRKREEEVEESTSSGKRWMGGIELVDKDGEL